MHPNRTRSQSANDRFWDRYIQAVEKQGVSERAARWYVKRAEQYLNSLPDKRLAQHTPEDVDGYLRRLGRLDGIEDWQFRQAVDAIQTLFRVAGLATADRVDWGFWQASAQSLMPDHPTLARETQPQEKPAVSGDRFKAKRNAPSPLDAIRAAHGPLLERLAAEIRRRRYSIRTEQSYEAWVCRFIAFHRGKDPAVLGAAQVVAFLEHLAVKGNVAASTQNQALNALMFLYKNILDQPLGELDAFTRPKRLPVVLDRSEVRRLLDRMEGAST